MSRTNERSRRTLLSAGVTVLILAVGCAAPGPQTAALAEGTSAPHASSAVPATPTPAPGISTSPPEPSTSADSSASPNNGLDVASVLSRLDKSAIVTASLGVPPANWSVPADAKPTEMSRNNTNEGQWFHASIAAASKSPPDVKYAIWQAYLAQGAVAEGIADAMAAKRLSDVVVGSTFDLTLPDGTVVPNVDGGTGWVDAAGAYYSASNEDLEQRVRELATKYGLTIEQIRIFSPLKAAVAITATVADKAKAAGNVGAFIYDMDNPTPIEGIYLEIRVNNETVCVQMGDQRVGVGSSWVKPGFEYLDTPHGGTPSR